MQAESEGFDKVFAAAEAATAAIEVSMLATQLSWVVCYTITHQKAVPQGSMADGISDGVQYMS
jgi:hypothetical protein